MTVVSLVQNSGNQVYQVPFRILLPKKCNHDQPAWMYQLTWVYASHMPYDKFLSGANYTQMESKDWHLSDFGFTGWFVPLLTTCAVRTLFSWHGLFIQIQTIYKYFVTQVGPHQAGHCKSNIECYTNNVDYNTHFPWFRIHTHIQTLQEPPCYLEICHTHHN